MLLQLYRRCFVPAWSGLLQQISRFILEHPPILCFIVVRVVREGLHAPLGTLIGEDVVGSVFGNNTQKCDTASTQTVRGALLAYMHI